MASNPINEWTIIGGGLLAIAILLFSFFRKKIYDWIEKKIRH
jgi:LPXTG-motif cell wall-anchored protein